MLLSVGLLVVSVLHDQLQRCIIIDMQHFMQALQRFNTVADMLSCSSGMMDVMHLVDSELHNVPELVWWPGRAANWCSCTGWCSTTRAVWRVGGPPPPGSV